MSSEIIRAGIDLLLPGFDSVDEVRTSALQQASLTLSEDVDTLAAGRYLLR